MGRDPPPSSTKLGKNMSQLMPQRPIYLARMMDELRIKRDQFFPIISAPRARLQSRIPFHAKVICDTRSTLPAKERTSNLNQPGDTRCNVVGYFVFELRL
jgi:hypothetical protein